MRLLFHFYCLWLPLILFLNGCKNIPTQPENSNVYRERVVISYSRINVVCPEDPNNLLLFCYRLYDPGIEEPFSDADTDEYIQGDYRVGSTTGHFFCAERILGSQLNMFLSILAPISLSIWSMLWIPNCTAVIRIDGKRPEASECRELIVCS